ncbi:MAG: hypothetical protein AB7O50_01115 [Pseudolabrys sp.]
MTALIRFDDSDAAPAHNAGVEGFGVMPPHAPPRPDAALTALVTGMALAVCIALAATALSVGHAQSGHAATAGHLLAAQPAHPAVAKI